MNGKQINPGDRIQTKYGDWYAAELVNDQMVYVRNLQNVIHASNIIKVEKGQNQ